MKNDMRIKKEFEDFHKTVTIFLLSPRSQILKSASLMEISGIGKDTSMGPRILYIKAESFK